MVQAEYENDTLSSSQLVGRESGSASSSGSSSFWGIRVSHRSRYDKSQYVNKFRGEKSDRGMVPILMFRSIVVVLSIVDSAGGVRSLYFTHQYPSNTSQFPMV